MCWSMIWLRGGVSGRLAARIIYWCKGRIPTWTCTRSRERLSCRYEKRLSSRQSERSLMWLRGWLTDRLVTRLNSWLK